MISMVPPTETNPEKIFDGISICQSSLPVSSPDVPENSNAITSVNALMPEDSQGEGEWVCGTDLMQKESGKNRPRLLPQGVKMMVFIEKGSRKTEDCSAWGSYLTSNKAQPEDLWATKELHNNKVYEKPKDTKIKQFSGMHPKKRFLKRFLQDQECC